MQNLRIENKLEILAGNVQNIAETAEGIQVKFHNRRTHENEVLFVDRVINCTGPESSLKRTENPVLHNMWKRGILTTDPLELGINADPISFKAIDKYGDKVNNLFTLGTNLRGMLWESTAVPELRGQAEKLAHILLEN
jgi:uncharacterized NAD(P)/FAD-binding protein YdhS